MSKRDSCSSKWWKVKEEGIKNLEEDDGGGRVAVEDASWWRSRCGARRVAVVVRGGG